jgi:tripartite-type tricarboxylate transporter receptor subunit TctC
MKAYQIALIGAAIATNVVGPTSAANYPTRPVTFVVPYAPGGATDLLARTLGHYLDQKLGQPFVIENKPGASSAIAGTFLSKAEPDGYTILMATSTTMAINPSAFKKLDYRPLVDLTPVALIANSPFVLVVNNDLPVRSVTDLVKLAKSRPGELNYGSSGSGSSHHLDMVLLSNMTGIKLTHVPYKGTVPALNDVMAGHVQMMFSDMSTALPLIRAGKLRAIGVSSDKRLAGAPELQTIAENGLPDYDAAAWQMVVMPAKTPDDIVNKLHDTLKAYQETSEFKKSITQRGLEPLVTPSRAEMKKFVKDEINRWHGVVESAGLSH